MRPDKKIAFYVFMGSFLLTLLFIEGGSFLAGPLLQKKGVFYNPVASPSYEDYLSRKDKTLGWPSPTTFGKDGLRDKSGSRIIPAFPDPDKFKECISLYGNSMTWSNDIAHEFSWSNVLAKLVDCRVSTYGVSGYGTDQALLRFLNNTEDKSKIVFLNHTSENILRNVNQFRGLLYPGVNLGFKPRFVVDKQGNIDLIPLPSFSAAEYEKFVKTPGQYLSYEYFIPDGPSGVTTLKFPYTMSIMRSLKHFHVKEKISGNPWYLEFYKKDHPSLALEVTVGILKTFYKEAVERKKIPIITIIPLEPDLVFYLDQGIWPYQSLMDELSKEGMEVMNFGVGILNGMENQVPSSLFSKWSHYNNKGYGMLAKIAYEFLKEKKLLELINQKP